MKKRKTKALALFSGGLDSILAVKILEKQGIFAQGLNFKSPFFNFNQSVQAARENNIKLKTVDFFNEHLQVVKMPKYGHGKNLNPCIDCHLLMLKKAKQIMQKEKFDLVATGEVLGQRPMSQNKRVLQLIAKESGLESRLIRPLSAKLLKPTDPEIKGLIDREKLFSIEGRSRKKQIALARKWNIKKYPSPAGGCLLTDQEFSQKLKKLFEKAENLNKNDLELLKIGRHFWQNQDKIIIGRNQEENKKLNQLKQKKDIIIGMENYTGPTALVRSYRQKICIPTKKRAKELVQKHSPKARGKKDVKFIDFSY